MNIISKWPGLDSELGYFWKRDTLDLIQELVFKHMGERFGPTYRHSFSGDAIAVLTLNTHGRFNKALMKARNECLLKNDTIYVTGDDFDIVTTDWTTYDNPRFQAEMRAIVNVWQKELFPIHVEHDWMQNAFYILYNSGDIICFNAKTGKYINRLPPISYHSLIVPIIGYGLLVLGPDIDPDIDKESIRLVIYDHCLQLLSNTQFDGDDGALAYFSGNSKFLLITWDQGDDGPYFSSELFDLKRFFDRDEKRS